MYVCMHGHMCHHVHVSRYVYTAYIQLIPVMLSHTLSCAYVHLRTFLGVLFCPSHACLDLLSIESPDSGIHEPPGDRWCGLPRHYPANRESMEFLKHKATEKSRLIKSDCETVTASRNKEVVCMYAHCHIVIPRAGVLQLTLPHTNSTCFSKKTESVDHTASMDHKRSSWSHHRSPDAKRPSKKIPATLPHTWDSSLHCMRSNTHYCSCIYCCEIVLCIWMIILQHHITESLNTYCWNSSEHCDCGMMTGIDYGQRNGGFNHHGLYWAPIFWNLLFKSPNTSLMDAWKLNM